MWNVYTLMNRLSSLLRSLRVNFHITHFQFYIILRWCLSREECMLEQLKAFHINKKERKRMGWADGLVPQCFQLQYMPCMLPKLSTWTVFTCLFWFMYASLGTDANSTIKYHIFSFQTSFVFVSIECTHTNLIIWVFYTWTADLQFDPVWV